MWQSVVATPSSTKSDYYAWSSPAVVGGHIYIGISSQGDHPLVRGGAAAFDQATGARLATYYTVPAGFVPTNGGSPARIS